MASKKKYWRSFEELTDSNLSEQLSTNEFAEDIPVDEFLGNTNAMENKKTSRRDFLKILGFSTAAVTLAACEAPIVKSVPYVVKPNDVTPGVPTYYASTIFDGYDYANVLVRTREGRPIRIDANHDARFFGSTNARVQASVLSLYDSDKVKGPMVKTGENKYKTTTWKDLDAKVVSALNSLGGKKAVILTPSLPSPTTKKLIQEFQAKYPTVQHVVFDAVSYSNALDAAQEVYGKREIPFYDFSSTELVISFNADFLGDYNGGGMESSYAAARKPGANMLRHIQVESVLSLTGANADTRIPKKFTDTEKLLAEVYNGLKGASVKDEAASIVKEIKAKGSKAVVLADGSKEAYALAFAINQMIASGAVTNRAVNLKVSNDAVFNQFIAEANAGNVGVLFTYQANPVYAANQSKAVQAAFSKIGLKVALTEKLDETASLADLVAPVTHALESWNDYNPITGVYSLQQPTIPRIFDSRQFQDSLITWLTGTSVVNKVENPNDPTMMMATSESVQPVSAYYEYLRNNWLSTILPLVGGIDFNQALYNGVNESSETTTFVANTAIADGYAAKLASTKAGEWEIQFYTKTGLGDGTQSNNPWLQELPDPITRNSWDNYITLNPLDAEKLGVKIQDNYNVHNGRMQFDGEYFDLTVDGVKLEKVPVFIQPGQAIGSIGLALGYGRTKAGKVGNEIGVNAYSLYKGTIGANNVTLGKTAGAGKHKFANMQQQPTLMGRYEIAREVSLDDFINRPREEWNELGVMPTWKGLTPEKEVDIWRTHDRSVGPHFKLSIDMNACTGCGACIIACQAENNVPVVGKDEIRMSRDMYWLRIDRYYSDVTDNTLTQKVALEGPNMDGKGDGLNEPQQYKLLIQPKAENPDVIFQPIMCQHCNHAPCETVCPVAATSHGRQGQNMMAYNRCIGTRYCANNCPYKVRRFNWFTYTQNDKFDFHMNNDLGRMVLNPDVVVRTRGVMEKCSFCIQQTQAAILKAKKENRRVTDQEFKDSAACAAACATGAMVFGDINDENSEVKKLSESNRSYVLLEEVGTQPNVFYHVKVRNRKEQKNA